MNGLTTAIYFACAAINIPLIIEDPIKHWYSVASFVFCLTLGLCDIANRRNN